VWNITRDLSCSDILQPDAVCKVGGLIPDLSYRYLGIFPGGGQKVKIVH